MTAVGVPPQPAVDAALLDLLSMYPGLAVGEREIVAAREVDAELQQLRVRVAELESQRDTAEANGAFKERCAIVKLLREKYALNRNARGFADCIELEEHYDDE